MKKNYLYLLTLLFIATMVLTFLTPIPTAQAQGSYGPREPEMIMKFYSDVEAAYTALKAGDIDMVMYDITAELYYDAIEDPSIQLASILDYGMYEIDINNNYTMPTYPDVRNPFNDETFRQAVAHLVDKDKVIEEFCKGFAVRIDVPVAAPTSDDWKNMSVSGPNYPYPYDPATAAAMLDAAGFVQGSTPNPYYDPDLDWSAECIRTYPSDWDGKAGEDLDPIIACISTGDIYRLNIGMDLVDHLRKIGIPVNVITGSYHDLYRRVFVDHDYHIYVGGWVVGRYPTYLYRFFHSKFWYPNGANHVTGVNKSGRPNYPLLDTYLENMWYAENIEDTKYWAKKAEGLLVSKAISIWLYSSKTYMVYRNLLGVVNHKLGGISNIYTYLKAKTTHGGPIRAALMGGPPETIDILNSSRIYEHAFLDLIYDAVFPGIAPYMPERDQPWTVQDWSVAYWVDPKDGLNKTKVSVWFRKNISWIKPVTGEPSGYLTSNDYAFSVWYTLSRDCWKRDHLLDIQFIEIIDDFSVEVYLNKKGYWMQYVPFTYVLNSTLLKKLGYVDINTTSFIIPGGPSPDPIVFDLRDYGGEQVLEVIGATLDGVPLIENEDYRVVSLDGSHTYIEFRIPVSEGQEFTITYWSPNAAIQPSPPSWDQILVGTGPFYASSFSPNISITLKANRNYWLETPPMGEIDFWWEWGPRDNARPTPNHPEGPRTGSYHVGISDLVLCTGAYDSCGNLVPDPHWFPGADVAPPECYIDISDVVVITGVYCTEFGHPPTDP